MYFFCSRFLSKQSASWSPPTAYHLSPPPASLSSATYRRRTRVAAKPSFFLLLPPSFFFSSDSQCSAAGRSLPVSPALYLQDSIFPTTSGVRAVRTHFQGNN